MKLLVDMNLAPLVDTFANAGFQAAHWSSLGVYSATDEEIMEYARAHGYIVVTQDLDFSTIHAATKGAKLSVVQIRSDDLRPEAIGKLVVEALLQMADPLDQGALLSTDSARTRLRVLPLVHT